MKKILVFVSSLDGKITKWGDPDVNQWTSDEDKKYFRELWKNSKLIVMGSTTFETEIFKPAPDRLLIIMTRSPEGYKALSVPGQIEFSKDSPTLLVSRFEASGYDEMIVAGGPGVAASFFKEFQIDEVWLTIEPKIFGSGKNLVNDQKFDVDLKLISVDKVNERGTLLTRYSVMKK